MTYPLSFDALRAANVARLPKFKNAKGELVHNHDGSDWILSQWMNAILGELGELSNLVKKVERGDFSLDDLFTDPKTGETMSYREYMGKEGADVVTYLDIAMFRMGVLLGEATRKKFNEISMRVGVDVFIQDNGDVWSGEECVYNSCLEDGAL